MKRSDFRLIDTRRQGRRQKQGFTLIEMLSVITIVGIVVGASAISFQGAIQGLALTSGSSEMVSGLSMARQIASSEGRNVEVRLYKHRMDGDSSQSPEFYRTMVLFRYFQPGEASPDPKAKGEVLQTPMAIPVGDRIKLGSGVAISEDQKLSTLLGSDTRPTGSIVTKQVGAEGMVDWTFGGAEQVEYRSFVMRPEGTSLQSDKLWYFTVAGQNEIERGAEIQKIKNFVCIQVDPVNGRILSYRP
jgi:uncharacterized protein (TIGR02596 family)